MLVFIFTVAGACGIVSSSHGLIATPEAAQQTDAIPDAEAQKGTETAVFAGGCFWGVEGVFEHVKGVRNVSSGYAGGTARSANYDSVSSGRTDHAESVRVTYDPAQVTYEKLLEIFFTVAHDPTEVNRQGPDVGRHYRSAIFYANDEQKELATRYIASINESKTLTKPVATEVVALTKFFDAESYHQDFMKKNPNQAYIVQHDKPKLEELKGKFPELYVKKW
ncbi:peptide-methionine (S)-S-oxide reductase MsrA [soil metagenome]